MSEEILKALTQLFAIITKQDGGVTDTEREFVINFFKQELDIDSLNEYLVLYDKFSGYSEQKEKPQEEQKKKKLTSVKDSVRTLGLCKKINKTLQQKQKIVVLMKILELVGSDSNFTHQRMEIINTISTVFNISKEEYKEVESFITASEPSSLNFENVMVVNAEPAPEDVLYKNFYAEFDGHLIYIYIHSVDMYFVKYTGSDSVVMNGFIMQPGRVYLYSQGSTIKTPAGDALYYSDLVSHFKAVSDSTKLSFYAKIDEFQFPNGAIGLRNIQISEGPGKLIGIMGASGAGKTTLLNALAGIEKPSNGFIRINGFDINTEKDKIHGVIGYVSQDDLLIEELTVYENLYYNAKLCFSNFTEEQLKDRVMSVLESLGLDQRADLRVGSVLDKTISGGQRKRLNIALELIREPGVLFVDEPTSGLSSRDSENVIDLLKELSLKGKLIFVVIHQPSSDIYKMFDKMYLMDTGGYPVFYGNPVEAVTYFKTVTNQVDKSRGQCETCGNVNPEQIFNIIEAKVVDEYGQLTNKRKINPMQWHEQFEQNFQVETVEEVNEQPPKSLDIPNPLKQSIIFTTRDLLSKISNKQYLMINLLEAPLLALILAFVIRYRNSSEEGYIFRFNDNIPAFLLMSIVVALFMGMTVSAEEIIRDRKILKRESFLNLSWNSYLFSKLAILFTLSALQTFTFVLIGNLILGMPEMILSHWFILFTCSCMANVLGLNISSAFNSAVTVYVLIPLLLIPQMILSGLLFSFDKLNDLISTRGEVPMIADFMASRWAYEAMAVDQFKSNSYTQPYYDDQKNEAMADFKAAYLAESLKDKHRIILSQLKSDPDSLREEIIMNLNIIKKNLEGDYFTTRQNFDSIGFDQVFSPEGYAENAEKVSAFLDEYKAFYQSRFNSAVALRERKMEKYQELDYYDLNEYKNKYFNESLADLVTNITVKERILEHDGRLIQQINPIYKNANPDHLFDYRTQFFAPNKHFLGVYLGTYLFNAIVIWLMTLILYFALYYELLAKAIDRFGKIKIGGKKS